jgi:hypothetical protein
VRQIELGINQSAVQIENQHAHTRKLLAISGHPHPNSSRNLVSTTATIHFMRAPASMSPNVATRTATARPLRSCKGGSQTAALFVFPPFAKLQSMQQAPQHSFLEYSTFQYCRRNILPLSLNKIPGKFLPPDQEFNRRTGSNQLN